MCWKTAFARKRGVSANSRLTVKSDGKHTVKMKPIYRNGYGKKKNDLNSFMAHWIVRMYVSKTLTKRKNGEK
jgi:hypothetical protein